MLRITFNGHANFLLENGEYSILIDPWFTGNPTAKANPMDYEQIDVILVTHGHGDHLGDAIEISKKYMAPIVAPFELAGFCQRRGAHVIPMNHGGQRITECGRVKMTNAIHSSAFIGKGAEYTGNPCGFIIDFGGQRIYFAGDTALFGDMKLIGELESPDIAILPIGDNFTMGAKDAAKAVEFIAPKHVIPMHYATFEVLDQSPDAFIEAIAHLDVEPVILEVGQSHEFGG